MDGRLQVGDEITHINGRSVVDAPHQSVISAMGEAAAQGEVVLKIRRKMPIPGAYNMFLYVLSSIAPMHHFCHVVYTLVNKKTIFELWNEEYRDGITTRGDKIGMILCIIKPLNNVRRKFSANHYAYW